MQNEKLIYRLEDYTNTTIKDYMKTSPQAKINSRNNIIKGLLLIGVFVLSIFLTYLISEYCKSESLLVFPSLTVFLLPFILLIPLTGALFLIFSGIVFLEGNRLSAISDCHDNPVPDDLFHGDEKQRIIQILESISYESREYRFNSEKGLRFHDIHHLVNIMKAGLSCDQKVIMAHKRMKGGILSQANQ